MYFTVEYEAVWSISSRPIDAMRNDSDQFKENKNKILRWHTLYCIMSPDSALKYIVLYERWLFAGVWSDVWLFPAKFVGKCVPQGPAERTRTVPFPGANLPGLNENFLQAGSILDMNLGLIM